MRGPHQAGGAAKALSSEVSSQGSFPGPAAAGAGNELGERPRLAQGSVPTHQVEKQRAAAAGLKTEHFLPATYSDRADLWEIAHQSATMLCNSPDPSEITEMLSS